MKKKDNISEEEWKKKLSKEQYYVLRQKGTEKPFVGKYWDNHENGTYYCSGCGMPLFESGTKYESRSGWPSFYEPIKNENISKKRDLTHGMIRTEVLCSKCGGHLGHVFKDGPQPTGERYCINSISLDFKPK